MLEHKMLTMGKGSSYRAGAPVMRRGQPDPRVVRLLQDAQRIQQDSIEQQEVLAGVRDYKDTRAYRAGLGRRIDKALVNLQKSINELRK